MDGFSKEKIDFSFFSQLAIYLTTFDYAQFNTESTK